MFHDIIGRLSGAVFGGRRRLAATLLVVATALLASAGSAMAYTPNPLPLNNTNWSPNAGFGSSSPGWYADAFGIIHLQGAAKQTSAHGKTANLLGTLPAAARPNREVFTVVHTFNGTYADLAIGPNGQIGVISPRPPMVKDLSFVSLEGISYQRADSLPASPIEINETNWTDTFSAAHPGFGATPAAWYKDGSGIVHLEGAVDQFFAGSGGISDPDLVGALPPAAAPARVIQEIVHTFNGTEAQVVIQPNGQIFVFPPDDPGVLFDPSFLSLESVSYQTGAVFNPIPDFNASNWTFEFEPGWVQDGAGIVHLQGAMGQTSANGPNANLIATLPPNVAPDRTVYTVVTTGTDTYADLAIEPNGQVFVIPPRPPAVEVLGNLSLDGVSYQPRQPPRPVPHALSLTRGGDVLTLLRKPRALELLVFKLGPRAHFLGAVKLGHAPAGPSRFAWGLRLNGRRLRPGAYIAELVATPAGGSLTEGPGVTFGSDYPTGPVRVLAATCSVAAATNGRC